MMAEKRSVTFFIAGPPQGKGRAKSTKTGHHYTPDKTVNYETRLAWEFQKAVPGWAPLDGPVVLRISTEYDVPSSWSKRKQMAALHGELLPTVKPDWDNIGKIVSDALNGIAYKDDKQIVDGSVTKWYGDKSGLHITIREA